MIGYLARIESAIAAGPTPFASEEETLKACLLRHGYTIAPNGASWGTCFGVRVIRNGRVVTIGNYEHSHALLIRRNRKLAALRGGK